MRRKKKKGEGETVSRKLYSFLNGRGDTKEINLNFYLLVSILIIMQNIVLI